MTDEEKAMTQFKKTFCTTCEDKDVCDVSILNCTFYVSIYEEAYLDGLAEGRKEIEKENEQLKKEISVLLSCKNCSENKGGYVCEKEYNDKCLSQKIEYIKELKEENAELKARIEKMKFDVKVEAKRNAYISQATLNHLIEQWEDSK